MLYPSINEIRKKADSRYTIVVMAAKRARDIIDGKPVLTDCEINKPVSIAAHEIAEDLITYKRRDGRLTDLNHTKLAACCSQYIYADAAFLLAGFYGR